MLVPRSIGNSFLIINRHPLNTLPMYLVDVLQVHPGPITYEQR